MHTSNSPNVFAKTRTKTMKASTLLSSALALYGVGAQDVWGPVRDAVDAAFIPGGVHVLIGCNATEKVFEQQKGTFPTDAHS
jgi:hypothetical protein